MSKREFGLTFALALGALAFSCAAAVALPKRLAGSEPARVTAPVVVPAAK